MKFSFTVQRGDHSNLIRASSAHEIVVREQKLTSSALLSAESVVENWPPRQLENLTAADMEAVLELQPEVILLGTGARQRFPDFKVIESAHRAGVGVEVMDTPAACRTYNILLQEGRRVVAALILEEP